MSGVRSESNQFPITPSSPNQKEKLTKKEKLILLRIGLMFFIEIVLPLIYYVLREFMPEIWALVISGAPPLFVVIYGLIRERRIDMFGGIIVISLVVTGIVSSLTKDARINLLRDCVVTGAIGLTFLITLIPIKIGSFQMRPLSYYFAKDMETGGSFHLQKETIQVYLMKSQIVLKEIGITMLCFDADIAFWSIGLSLFHFH
jgi:hypothetical protein